MISWTCFYGHKPATPDLDQVEHDGNLKSETFTEKKTFAIV